MQCLQIEYARQEVNMGVGNTVQSKLSPPFTSHHAYIGFSVLHDHTVTGTCL